MVSSATFVNRPYRFPATQFSPAYQWNNPAEGIEAEDVDAMQLGANGQVESGNGFTAAQQLTVGSNAYAANVGDATVDGVTKAFKERFAAAEATNDLSALRMLPEFDIYFSGDLSLGYHVETDGAGNITLVKSITGNDSQRNGDKSYPGEYVDRAKVTEGTMKVALTTGGLPIADAVNKPGVPSIFAQRSLFPEPLDNSVLKPGISENRDIPKITIGDNALQSLFKNIPETPTLPSLRRIQAPVVEPIDTSIIGNRATLAPEKSSNVATVQAGLYVNYDDELTLNNLKNLRENAAHHQLDSITFGRERSMPASPFALQQTSQMPMFQNQTSNPFTLLSTAADTGSTSGGGTSMEYSGQGNSGGSSQQKRNRNSSLSLFA